MITISFLLRMSMEVIEQMGVIIKKLCRELSKAEAKLKTRQEVIEELRRRMEQGSEIEEP